MVKPPNTVFPYNMINKKLLKNVIGVCCVSGKETNLEIGRKQM